MIETKLDTWVIEDSRVSTSLVRSGFRCYPVAPGGLWHFVDCPISFNGRYRLRDGTVIESRGTKLVLEGTPPEKQSWVIKDWRVFALLERHGMAAKSTSPGWAHTWYATDCPIAFNGSYVFPCGHVIASQGTQLVFAGYRGRQ